MTCWAVPFRGARCGPSNCGHCSRITSRPNNTSSVLDYDDLLLYWAHMMGEPAIAAEIAGRFDHVLVDEYQDTNALQARVLLALRPHGSGLTVVGDDAQSIYSFRAATVRNILDFPAHFSPRAEVVTLEQNYRSHAADPRRRQRRHRAGAGEVHQELVVGTKIGGEALPGECSRRSRSSALHRRESAGGTRARDDAQDASRPVPRIAPFRAAGSRTDAAAHSVREIRRAEIP